MLKTGTKTKYIFIIIDHNIAWLQFTDDPDEIITVWKKILYIEIQDMFLSTVTEEILN